MNCIVFLNIIIIIQKYKCLECFITKNTITQHQHQHNHHKQQIKRHSLLFHASQFDDNDMNEIKNYNNRLFINQEQRGQSLILQLQASSSSSSSSKDNTNNNTNNNNKKDIIETWRIYDVKISSKDDTSSIPISRKEEKELIAKIPIEKRYVTKVLYAKVKEIIKKNTSSKKLARNRKDKKKRRNVESTFETNINIVNIRVVRKSLDARKNRGSRTNYNSINDSTTNVNVPMYVYVVDVDFGIPFPRFKSSGCHKMDKLTSKSKLISKSITDDNKTYQYQDILSLSSSFTKEENLMINTNKKPKIVIIGYGPAGIFTSYYLQSKHQSKFQTIVIEKGQSVEKRGKDIGQFIGRRELNTQSNFCYGEGGAGTFSDGKLTTRIGRNSNIVRYVLSTLVKYGAPDKILVDGSPHLGTDNLVRLLRNMRNDYINTYEGDVRFNANVLDIQTSPSNKVKSIKVQYNNNPNQIEIIEADAIVIATGHSSRDIYDILYKNGDIKLQSKGFSVGFRIEHPQYLINKIQYGDMYGGSVVTGNRLTDRINKEYFFNDDNEEHKQKASLPVASYRLAASNISDGDDNADHITKKRSVYSFCMCPGGQIVSTSVTPNELCVNGMSFSRRDSKWANSALVVTAGGITSNDNGIDIIDPILQSYCVDGNNSEDDIALAGIKLQEHMERQASILGGGGYVCPVQRVTDFLDNKSTSSTTHSTKNFPTSSYRLGVKESSLCNTETLYPTQIINSLQNAISTNFERYMPGYVSDQALLHAVETRTSSPVRITRDDSTLQSTTMRRLYPTGEGAGYAGGIISAAVDGLYVANAIYKEFYGDDDNDDDGDDIFESNKSIGFDY